MTEVTAGLPWWVIFVEVLAAARLTRLLTRDSLPPLRRARMALIKRTDPEWSAVWTCTWCLSVWVAVFMVLAHVLLAVFAPAVVVAVWVAMLAPLAVSHIVGLLAETERS